MDLDNKVGETVENASVEADGKDVTNTYVTESARCFKRKNGEYGTWFWHRFVVYCFICYSKSDLWIRV